MYLDKGLSSSNVGHLSLKLGPWVKSIKKPCLHYSVNFSPIFIVSCQFFAQNSLICHWLWSQPFFHDQIRAIIRSHYWFFKDLYKKIYKSVFSLTVLQRALIFLHVALPSGSLQGLFKLFLLREHWLCLRFNIMTFYILFFSLYFLFSKTVLHQALACSMF